MGWIFSLILSLAAGWFVSRTLAAALFQGGRAFVRTAGEIGMGILFGPGLASVLYFGSSAAGLGGFASAYAIPIALACAGAAIWWPARNSRPATEPVRAPFRWRWPLLVGLGFACLFLAFDIAAATGANPNGEWDATGIWNVRARFLAAGPATWHRAISADLGGAMAGASHPGYPLFLSSFVGMLWAAAGSYPASVPATTGIVVAAGLLLLLAASLAGRRSLALGLVATLLLTGTELFASQASAQYSDLLLALSFLASLALLEAAAGTMPAPAVKICIAAGLAIGFAPWIKNEGLPFAVIALAAAAWRLRAAVVWVLIGAAPGLLATVWLKIIAAGRESVLPATVGEALSKMGDLSRWWQTLVGFAGAVVQLGPVWAHPVLLLAVVIWSLGFRGANEVRARLWLGVPIIGALAAEYGLFLVTTADLGWHISTSVTRLVTQVWPSILWLLFSVLKSPEEYFATEKPVPGAASVRGRKRVN